MRFLPLNYYFSYLIYFYPNYFTGDNSFFFSILIIYIGIYIRGGQTKNVVVKPNYDKKVFFTNLYTFTTNSSLKHK